MTNGKPNNRVPKQKRSQEKRERIMEAAMDLFAQKGIHNTNSKEIAAAAGVPIGSFYYYFKDKKKLLVEVLDTYLRDHFDRIWQGGPEWTVDNAAGNVLIYMKRLMAAYEVAPDFHRETHVLRYSDPDVKALYDKDSEREVEKITSNLKQFKEHILTDDLHSAAILIHSSAESLAHKIKFMGTLDEERLLQEFTTMLARYILKN